MSKPVSNAEKIKECLDRIETLVGYGSTTDWTHRNFESLSANIEQKTGILLSVSTLKRVWSSNYKSLPQKATLDTLAQFIDYKDWFDFVSSSVKPSRSTRVRNRIIILAVTVILVILGIIFYPKILNLKQIEKNDFENSPQEVLEGVKTIQERDSANLELLKEVDLHND